jgi:hypothetical protein
MDDSTVSRPFHHVVDGVYISGHRVTQFAKELREAGITNVLKLYEDIPYLPSDFNTFENVLDDGELIPPLVLRHGTNFIMSQVDAGNPVIVMCTAGISRSSTFVLAYLLQRDYDLKSAFLLLRKHHPQARPHPRMWQSLITQYQLRYKLEEILEWLEKDN